jgi:hypothetical protein
MVSPCSVNGSPQGVAASAMMWMGGVRSSGEVFGRMALMRWGSR